MTERFGFQVVPVPRGLLISDYGVYEVGVTIYGIQRLQHEVAFALLQSFRHFPYNENSTRAIPRIVTHFFKIHPNIVLESTSSSS